MCWSGSSGGKVERIAGVESVDTFMNCSDARGVAADPSAIGDLWPVSLKPDNGDGSSNDDDEWVEENGRDSEAVIS